MSAVQSVLTATRVLERLSEPGLVGVSELSRDLKLPKSSVQRMLLTLKEAGWAVDVRGETTRWTLTPKMFRLGQHHHAGNGLRSTALPVMEQLRDATRETVHLVVQRDDSVVVVECLDSPQAVRAHVNPGDVLPLHASTNGRALLSTQPDTAVRDLISKGLTRVHPAHHHRPRRFRGRHPSSPSARLRCWRGTVPRWRPRRCCPDRCRRSGYRQHRCVHARSTNDS